LLSLGHVLRFQGRYAAAHARYEEGLAIGREHGSQSIVAYALTDLGLVELKQGDHAAAWSLIQESLAIWKGSGGTYGVIRCLEGLAQLAWAKEQPLRTAQLFGAASSFREKIRCPLPPVDRADYDCLPVVRAALGGETFDAAWAEGGAMTLDQAMEHALGDATPAGE